MCHMRQALVDQGSSGWWLTERLCLPERRHSHAQHARCQRGELAPPAGLPAPAAVPGGAVLEEGSAGELLERDFLIWPILCFLPGVHQFAYHVPLFALPSLSFPLPPVGAVPGAARGWPPAPAGAAAAVHDPGLQRRAAQPGHPAAEVQGEALASPPSYPPPPLFFTHTHTYHRGTYSVCRCSLMRCCWRAPARLLQTSLLDFAPAHATSYNGFVDIVRFNLVTADWCAALG